MNEIDCPKNSSHRNAQSGRRTRVNLRLEGWDYKNSGHYFITFSTFERKQILGAVLRAREGAKVRLFLAGRICVRAAKQAEAAHKGVRILSFVVMPNHVHAIIELSNDGAGDDSVSKFVHHWKGLTTHICRQHGVSGRVWQRSFYDRIIRNAAEEESIAKYIEHNPLRWVLREKGTDCGGAELASARRRCQP